MQDHDHDHDHGLPHDLQALHGTLLRRRRALVWLAGAGTAALPMFGCDGSSGAARATATTPEATGRTTTTTTASSCAVIPTETNGPYPADGSTALNALLLSGIVRSDIRKSVAGATATASGVPLTVTLTLINANSSCASLAGYAIYIWHCNQSGQYSLYSAGVSGENYLRGVQVTDSNGQVTFTTIFPACSPGRWPHIHVEIYPSLSRATRISNVVKTTQIALPQAACNLVFASTGYGASVTNFSQITLATDNVFSDGGTLETPTISGSVAAGYALELAAGIAG